MSSQAHRFCSPSCRTLVVSGRCQACTVQDDHRRGSAASRGYGAYWQRFRLWVFSELDRLFVAGIGDGVVCGARLPGTLETQDSLCQLEGRITTTGLHLDHFPPLTIAERSNKRAICNPARVQVLCWTCHNAKTIRERAGG